MAGSVLNSTAVLRLNFCAKLNICASISATSPSCNPLCSIKTTMRIQFIAQGLNDQSKTVGKYLCSSFQDENYNKFFCFSAFTKLSGLNIIKDDLQTVKQRYKSLKFFLGITEKGTSKEAL